MKRSQQKSPILLFGMLIIVIGVGTCSYVYLKTDFYYAFSTNLAGAALNSIISESVSTCQNITSPGSYTLSKDIATTTLNAACIRIQNTGNVALDCAGHSIKGSDAITVVNANHFSIQNCLLQPSDSNGISLRISSSTQGTMTANTFGTVSGSSKSADSVNLDGTSNITFGNNIFHIGYYQQNSTGNTIQGNTMSIPLSPINFYSGGVISLISGSSTTISGNSIMGHLVSGDVGTDDGIDLYNEVNDMIQNNTIQNVFDCGIENSGYMFGAHILNNTIKKAIFCGIGGWYGSSVKDSVISNNAISNSKTMFLFYRVWGLKPGDPPVYFENNTFAGNTFTLQNISNGVIQSAITILPQYTNLNGGRPVRQADIIAGNNTFTGNTFGYKIPPLFEPFNMIVDGGNNKCLATSTDPKTGKSYPPVPFKCN